jgi:hypothetical protein
MNNLNKKDDIDIEMQSRIKVNIYKTLLEEEKHKNKRNTTIGLSLFIVGVVSTTALYRIRDISEPQSVKINSSQRMERTVARSSDSVPKYLESDTELDILNNDVLKERKLSNFKEEDFFVSDFKM